MNVRPRLLISSFATSSRLTSSNRTKTPTHYETLEVNNRATQGEIKSAYFKLSKQYHPDINSSEAATAKFRNVAEAYEVLGNYNSRRTYDRSILTKTSYNAPSNVEKPTDPMMKYYQAQAAIYRQNTKSGSTPIYDFDAWTRAHYGRTLERNLQGRMHKEMRKKRETTDFDIHNPGSRDVGLVLFALVTIFSIVMMGIHEPTGIEDTPIVGQRNDDRKKESEMEIKELAAVPLSSK